MAVEKHSRMTPQVAEGLLHPYDSWQHRRAIYEFIRDIPASKSHPSYPRLEALEAELPKLSDLPTLLIWGMRDWCFRPECLTRLEALLPQASTLSLPDAGHYCVEDAHEQIAPAIRRLLSNHPIPEETRR